MGSEMKPDKVCEKYFDKDVKLTVIVENDMVYIEGSRIDLEFLGKLLLAQASYSKDDSFHISPTGAGSGLFNKNSTAGICIQRIDKNTNTAKD